MKKTFGFLSIATLALVGAMMTGCSSDDKITEELQQPESKLVTLTTTVGLGGDAVTRALAADGTKTFADGETMAIVYKNKSGNTLKAVSAPLDGNVDIYNTGKNANFTFTLNDPDKTENVTYIYPASMAKADGTPNYDALATQNGTLATIASNLDYCTNSGAWDADALPTLTLDNQLAILVITLKNNAETPAEITSGITGMTISDGTNNYAVSRSTGAGPIYVAIRPTSSANIEVTATDGSHNYAKPLTGKTYEANNGYNVSWRMALAPLADAFVDGNTTVIAFTSTYGDLTLSSTYSGGSFGAVAKEGGFFASMVDASMEKDGNNLKINVTVNYMGTIKSGSMTINTVNNTYTWSNATVGAMITLNSITIGGNSITPLPNAQ